MKKILLIAAVAGLTMASCKKDRTCKCTTTNGSTTGPEQTYTLTKSKKGDAKDACSNTSWSNTSGSSTTSGKTDCKLS